MNKIEKIRYCMKALKEGKTIYIDNGKMWQFEQNNKKYICYRHFGQSATRCSIKDLTWIINVIFEKSRKDFDYRIGG